MRSRVMIIVAGLSVILPVSVSVSAACRMVQGYTRADGTQVSSYRRCDDRPVPPAEPAKPHCTTVRAYTRDDGTQVPERRRCDNGGSKAGAASPELDKLIADVERPDFGKGVALPATPAAPATPTTTAARQPYADMTWWSEKGIAILLAILSIFVLGGVMWLLAIPDRWLRQRRSAPEAEKLKPKS